jgi:hypothetical protein
MSEKTQMQELTTCCFCGSESVEAIPDHDEDGPMFWVYCGRCEAQGPVIYSVPSEGHTATPAEAIAAWNTRATATPTEGEGVRTIARRITRELRKGCGDNSCYFRQSQRGGMGTNGGCRCHERVAEILAARTPQPTDAARAEAQALLNDLIDARTKYATYSGATTWEHVLVAESRFKSALKHLDEAAIAAARKEG